MLKTSWLTHFIPRIILRASSPYNRDIRVVEENRKYKLLVNGSVQSGPYMEKLWRFALRNFKLSKSNSVKKILVLGIAGGTVIRLLREIYLDSLIIGVDIDQLMIDLGRRYFGLSNLTQLKFVCADAKKVIFKLKSHTYDLIVVDMSIGPEVPEFVLSASWLEQVKNLLSSGGIILVNYLRDRHYKQKAEKFSILLNQLFGKIQTVERLNNRFFLAQ